MGGLTSAVHWWEEWQLRVLVLTSLAVQFLLLIFSYIRSFAVAGWVRFLMWLAYLAGDAVVIYALATLFNRHKAAGEDGGGGMLEVVWAPILLLHLGGHDGITAYNIEDNELWSRHLVTAVSQVTVAIYVFCKSWPPGGDKRLLQSAILLFVPGVLKCFLKPWALKSASIYSLVSSSPAAVKQINEGEMMYPLEVYVERASKGFLQVQTEEAGEVQVAGASVDDGDRRPRCSKEPRGTAVIGELMEDFSGAWAALIGRVKGDLVGKWAFVRGLLKADEPSQGSSFFGRLREMSIRQSRNYQVNEKVKEMIQGRSEASKLFVDLSSSYPRRLSVLQEFWGLTEQKAYGSVRQGLATAFLLLYTKFKTVNLDDFDETYDIGRWLKSVFTSPTQMSRMLLPWAAIGLFHHSHREAYNDIDVKITYVILCCTAALEYSSMVYFYVIRHKYVSMTLLSDQLTPEGVAGEQWPEMVAQYSFIGYFARNVKHSKIMWIVSLLGCKDFLDQHWCMKSCFSSDKISELVLRYLKDGWRKKIKDAASYRSFNDHRSSEGRRQSTNRNRPLLFDESVLLWHIVTDLCFFSGSFAEHTTCCAFAMVPTTLEQIRKCARGTDSPIENDQTTSSPCREEPTGCKAVLCRQMSNYMAYLLFVNPEMLLPGSRRYLFTAAHQELEDIIKDEKPPLEETELTRKIISKLKPSSQAGSGPPETLIQEAWVLADNLMKNNLGDEKKMWEVIQGVWVEMLCFSASRCRGYLHAKALGKGGEFLSYVWLLLFYMGMETFTDKLNREEEATNNAATAPPSASERVSSTTTGAGAPSTSSDIHTASAGTGAAPSTSEIRMAEDDDMV